MHLTTDYRAKIHISHEFVNFAFLQRKMRLILVKNKTIHYLEIATI